MRRFILALCLLLGSGICVAQSGGARYDNFTWTTAQAGNVTALAPAPGATIAVCGVPANGTPCTNYVPTYTSATLTTACPSSTPIVLQGTTTCVANSDSQGNFGFWTAGGTFAYTVTYLGNSYGPYTVTQPPPTVIATAFPGTDLGAQINAADAYLGSTCGTILVNAPGTIATAPALSSCHTLQLNAPVSMTTTITTCNANTSYIGSGAAAVISFPNIVSGSFTGNFMKCGSQGFSSGGSPGISGLVIKNLWAQWLTAPGYTLVYLYTSKDVLIDSAHTLGGGILYHDSMILNYANVTPSDIGQNIRVVNSYADGCANAVNGCTYISSASYSGAVAKAYYISGGTITGTVGQTCLLTAFNNGSTAAATIYLTGTNTILSTAPLYVTTPGDGATAPPTTATLGNGTAACSGTATIQSVLGEHNNATGVVLAYASHSFVANSIFKNVGNGVEVWGGNAADYDALGNPRWAQNDSTSNVTCFNVQSCTWASMGQNVVFTGGNADTVSDVAFDCEGSINCGGTGNSGTNAQTACYSAFFWNRGINWDGGTCLATEPGGNFITINNASLSPNDNLDIVFQNMHFNCTIPAQTCNLATYFDPADGARLLNNQSMDVIWNLVSTTSGEPIGGYHNNGYEVAGNDISFDFNVPTGNCTLGLNDSPVGPVTFCALTVDAVDGATALIHGNRFHYLTSQDSNATDVYEGNGAAGNTTNGFLNFYNNASDTVANQLFVDGSYHSNSGNHAVIVNAFQNIGTGAFTTDGTTAKAILYTSLYGNTGLTQLYQLQGSDAAPTLASGWNGSGAGSSPTAGTPTGSSVQWKVPITTGGTPSSGAQVFTITFASPRAAAPICQASSAYGSLFMSASSTTTATFSTFSGVALPASTAIVFNGNCN